MPEFQLDFPVWVLAEPADPLALPEGGVRLLPYSGVGTILPIFTERRFAERLASQGPGFVTAKPRPVSAAELIPIVKAVINELHEFAGFDPEYEDAGNRCRLSDLLTYLEAITAPSSH